MTDGLQQFVNDDTGYLQWLADHPAGFVVNSHRNPTPAYLILHRASCGTVNSASRSNWTTGDYIKTCSTNPTVLKEWAARATGGRLSPCGLCQPGQSASPSRQSAQEADGSPERSVPASRNSPASPRSIPATISSGCPELDSLWAKYAAGTLDHPQFLIPDTEDDLNWHAFLGHGFDMQGFRAAEFVGVDPPSRSVPGYVPLKQRGLGIPELAALWDVPVIRDHLLGPARGTPVLTTLDVLRREGGEQGRSLAEAFETFRSRTMHSTIRAFLQNSHALKHVGYTFRGWLQRECARLGEEAFPPPDFRRTVAGRHSLEMELRQRLMKTFYQVGPALAPYMLCDWQLGLWKAGRTAVFANFKLDSFHEQFVGKYGRGVIPQAEQGFADWWLSLYPELPPRLANECIWLGVEHGDV